MKTKLFTLLLAVAASIGTIFAWDYEKVQIGDLYYNLDATNKTAEVAGYSSATGDFVIPASVTYNSVPYSVTSIGDDAFRGCRGLTSVTIPNSVTSIGYGAFHGLTSPVYNAHVFAFMPTTYSGAYTIPEGIESIAGGAFDGCTGLTSITIPYSVTSIGIGAFRGCTGLTSVTIPNSVTSIGNQAFYNCSGLTSPVYNAHVFAYLPTSYSGAYTIPDGIESIAGGAFFQCTGLTSVTIPNSVTSIGEFAFAFCSGLTSIYATCGDLERVKQLFNNDSRVKYAPLKYSITCNVNIIEAGSVQIPENACEDVITAIPNYGYHFTQWSDGNTDNSRTIVLTQDTTFTAEFAVDRVGTCGKDFALTWSYDHSTKVLTIGNAGEFTENMRFGVEAPNEMKELVIGNSVTAIGANAFAGISSLKNVSIGESVKTISEQAFFNCVNLETIFNYRPTPTNAYSTAFDGVDKFECKLYVLPNSIDMYKAAAVWRDFYYTSAIGAEETTITTNDVQVEPQDNAATLTWPTSNNAASYTIQITKDGVVFCTLIFNSAGQLIGIAFAPSRDGSSHAPAATVSVAGMSFTVTGLSSASKYAYNLSVADDNNQEIVYYQGEFATTGYEGEVVPGGEPVIPGGGTTAIDNVNPSTQSVGTTKFFRNGQLFIQRGNELFNAQGARVK